MLTITQQRLPLVETTGESALRCVLNQYNTRPAEVAP